MNELADEKTIRRTALIARAEHTAEDILQLDDDVHGSVGVFIYELCQNNYENKGCTMSILENFIGGREGLGYMIIYGSQVFKLDWLLMSICILCVIAMLLYALIGLIEKWYLCRCKIS